MQVVDFTNLPRRNKLYAGANGSKISVIYEGQQYMLKFPPLPSKNKEMSYSNSCFSEYLGCQIYESIGIPVQKTMLGTYTVKGKTKIVVACGDFTEPGITLQDFASLKNQIIDSERNGYGTELSDILHTFEEQEAIDREVITERFWDMFIVDALIGNWDRHNGIMMIRPFCDTAFQSTTPTVSASFSTACHTRSGTLPHSRTFFGNTKCLSRRMRSTSTF